MIRALIHRIEDWQRERRIHRLTARCARLLECGQKDSAMEVFGALCAECAARSPQQVARMERRMGVAQ